MKPSPNYTPIFLFLIFHLFFLYVHSQVLDSCTSPLYLPKPIPIDTTSLQCVSAWGSQNFILRYGQKSPNVWSFVLSAPNTNSYIGIGFSPDGNMVGSSAIVGWVTVDGISNIKKYYLGGKTPNQVILQSLVEGLQVSNLYIETVSNQIYMAFQLTVDQPNTRLIYAIGPTGKLPVAPNFLLPEHRDRFSTFVNYATGQFARQSYPESNVSSLKTYHGLLGLVGWAIFMSIGAMIARYMRHWDNWFYSHVTIQLFGFILGIFGIICGLILENRLDVSVVKHKGLGIIILVLGGLQVVAFIARPGKLSKDRKCWNLYHANVGRVLIVLAIINVFYGIYLGKAPAVWNQGFAVVIVILAIIIFTLEMRRCTRDD